MTPQEKFDKTSEYQSKSGSPSFAPSDWSSERIAVLIRLYSDQPLPVDKLPYTKVFEALVELLNHKTGGGYHPHTVFGMLIALRKAERLPLKR